MTAISLTAHSVRREPATLAIPAFIASFFASFFAGARDGLEIEARYHALDRKSTRGLAKLGLTRADIAQAALTGKTR